MPSQAVLCLEGHDPGPCGTALRAGETSAELSTGIPGSKAVAGLCPCPSCGLCSASSASRLAGGCDSGGGATS